MRETNIILIDDHTFYHKCFPNILKSHKELCLIECFKSIEETKEYFEDYVDMIDLVILDILLPDGYGDQLIKWLKHVSPKIKILVLSSYDYIETIAVCMNKGADGYMVKSQKSEELFVAIAEVVAGSPYIPKSICINQYQLTRRQYKWIESLNEMEHLFIKLSNEGKTLKEIGLHLVKSVRTVEKYRDELYFKCKLEKPNKISFLNICKKLLLI